MKPIKVAHIFYQTHMGLGHDRIGEIFRKKTKRVIEEGEVVIFVNRPMTAVKLMVAGRSFLYHRAVELLTVDAIRSLPQVFGAPALPLSQQLKINLAQALQEAQTREEMAA